MKPSSIKRKSIGIYLLIAVATFSFSILLILTQTIQKTELAIRDSFFEIRGPLSVEDSPIVLVAISDEADAEILEKWPWPTSVHAKLVENLTRAGAKTILFDVIFSNQDIYDSKNDTVFASMIAAHGGVVLSGALQESSNMNSSMIVRDFPIEILVESNPNPVGLVQTTDNIDGFVRIYNLGQIANEQSFYMLGLEGLRIYQNLESGGLQDLSSVTKNEPFTVGDYTIQRDNLNSFIINYYGPEGIFPQYSFDHVIDDSSYSTVDEDGFFEMNLFDDPTTQTGLLYDEVFKDKIVIVGSTMTTLQDFHPTPFSSADLPRPGFEIHAHAMQTILDGNYITRQKGGTRLLIMLLVSLMVVFFNRFMGAGWGFAFMAFLMIAYYGIAILLFLKANFFINVSGVLITVFVSQIGTAGYEYLNEQKEKRRIKGMFSSYVSPALVDQMIESGEEPKLGGDDTYMTAFFSDIVSFSTFSEKLEPKQLVTLINEYLTAMTDIINEQGGTLDKFIGDAIVAFFGAPVPIKDHALRACISSQLMEIKLAELRKKWERDKWPEIVWDMQHRMGMNTGDMVTGNMGSERRFNYTMMGDNVNLAARCESGAKQYNVFTMITESTKIEAESQGDDCLFRLLDNIVVKGRSKPVKVFEIAGLRKDAPQQMFDCIGLYEQGMQSYFNQEWDTAIKHFEQALPLEAHLTNPSQLFIKRCKMMKENPPAKEWNGVYIMTSK
ncbi:MAG: adenylate/guanylate cyclase domain-containing protein [Balneolaceae bacterium]